MVGKLDAGTEVAVERSEHGWSLVSAPNMRGYLPSRVVRTATPQIETARNPNCDLGYPYSGSSAYFGGLTELRTSGPLGALFGYHISRPC